MVWASAYNFTIAHGKDALARLKSTEGFDFEFVSDGVGIAELPSWVRGRKQITDGHLLNLARAQSAVLATLDEAIRGAYLIPGSR